MKVNGKNVEFTFDTGAEVSTVTEGTAERLNLRLEEPSTVLAGIDGRKLRVVGKAGVQLESKYRVMETEVYVVKGLRTNFLGITELRQLKLFAVVNAVCESKFEAVKECRSIKPVKPFSSRTIIAGSSYVSDDVELQNLTKKSDRESEVKRGHTGQDWWTCKTKEVKSSE